MLFWWSHSLETRQALNLKNDNFFHVFDRPSMHACCYVRIARTWSNDLCMQMQSISEHVPRAALCVTRWCGLGLRPFGSTVLKEFTESSCVLESNILRYRATLPGHPCQRKQNCLPCSCVKTSVFSAFRRCCKRSLSASRFQRRYDAEPENAAASGKHSRTSAVWGESFVARRKLINQRILREQITSTETCSNNHSTSVTKLATWPLVASDDDVSGGWRHGVAREREREGALRIISASSMPTRRLNNVAAHWRAVIVLLFFVERSLCQTPGDGPGDSKWEPAVLTWTTSMDSSMLCINMVIRFKEIRDTFSSLRSQANMPSSRQHDDACHSVVLGQGCIMKFADRSTNCMCCTSVGSKKKKTYSRCTSQVHQAEKTQRRNVSQ